MQMMPEKCPAVRFEKFAIEDRNATIAAGRRILKDVDMAWVKQIGERDETPCIADEWIEKLYAKAIGSNGSTPTIPMEWYERAKTVLSNWRKGFETPLEGYPVREWAILTPAQVQNLHGMDTFSVEQIAAWNEGAVARYGMGGREMRDKARLWLESGDQKAEQIQALQAENKDLKTTLQKLMDKVDRLENAQNDDDEKPKRGRPRNADSQIN